MRESICLRFSYRLSDEGARSQRKNRRQILSCTDRANEVNKTFIIMAFDLFSSLFIALCSSSDVAVYITSEFLGFASCLHSLGMNLPRLYINNFQ